MNELIFSESLRQLAEEVLAKASDYWIATAESCTGGLVAACLTGIPGSSRSFDRGFVTYSNSAKSELLGVDPELIARHGAVSSQVAGAMAAGALAALPSLSGISGKRGRVSVSVTGIAGPDGGTAEKPVGLVHFCVAIAGAANAPVFLHREARFGNIGRGSIREEAVRFALRLTIEALQVTNPA